MPNLISEEDRKRWLNGACSNAYELLGAHPVRQEGREGIRFAVWAPAAERVSVVGTFNGWDGGADPMAADEKTGIWEGFVPDANPGDLYKFEISGPDGESRLKADPYAFSMEMRPNTASRVYDIEGYAWNDGPWIRRRTETQAYDRPLSIYEVHLGSWKKGEGPNGFPGYRETAEELVPYVKELGFTHIELMPVAEYPYDPSWGYQVTGYYAPTSRYGDPKDFMYFVDRCHQEGLGVIMDWVPGHFPKDDQGLYRFDGTALYEYGDPLKGEHKEWGTAIFDYGEPGVVNFLVSNAIYWFDRYHIDGLRVDAVASMLYLDYGKGEGEWRPNPEGGKEHLEAVRFLRQVNRTVSGRYPGVLTIAEESTAWPGVTESPEKDGLGFDYKWNMGWMNDTLNYIGLDDRERRDQPEKITFPAEYATGERYVLPLSHDEVVHLKKPLLRKSPGSESVQFANLRLLYTYLMTHPGKKLLFMGSEIAPENEWSESEPLAWDLLDRPAHRGIRRLLSDLLRIYREEPALHRLDNRPGGFEWVDLDREEQSFFAYARKPGSAGVPLLVALNFSDRFITDWRPSQFNAQGYQVIFNSDSVYYGGQNRGKIVRENGIRTGRIAPLSGQIFKPVRG